MATLSDLHNASLESEKFGLEKCSALVLNADFRPLSYFPLSLCTWQESVKAALCARVNVLAHYDRVIRSPSLTLPLPSVISLKSYIRPALYPAFTRFNVFLRDHFSCQYCGVQAKDLTFDHVVPRAQGGRTTWDNVVAACASCNLKKGGNLPTIVRMYPRFSPRRPTTYELNACGRLFPPNYLHESWIDYLYWDVELEP